MRCMSSSAFASSATAIDRNLSNIWIAESLVSGEVRNRMVTCRWSRCLIDKCMQPWCDFWKSGASRMVIDLLHPSNRLSAISIGERRGVQIVHCRVVTQWSMCQIYHAAQSPQCYIPIEMASTDRLGNLYRWEVGHRWRCCFCHLCNPQDMTSWRRLRCKILPNVHWCTVFLLWGTWWMCPLVQVGVFEKKTLPAPKSTIQIVTHL